jgi:hypothetical protein
LRCVACGGGGGVGGCGGVQMSVTTTSADETGEISVSYTRYLPPRRPRSRIRSPAPAGCPLLRCRLGPHYAARIRPVVTPWSGSAAAGRRACGSPGSAGSAAVRANKHTNNLRSRPGEAGGAARRGACVRACERAMALHGVSEEAEAGSACRTPRAAPRTTARRARVRRGARRPAGVRSTGSRR